MQTTILVALAAVILLCAAIIFILLRKNSSLNESLGEQRSETIRLENEKRLAEERLRSQQENFDRLEQQRAESQQRLEEQREETEKKLAEEREKLFESQRRQMEESFRKLSEQNSAGLRRQNAESITELLKPIQEKFGEFDRTVRSSQEKAVQQDASMRQLLQTLMEQSKSVGDEARNLADAMSGRSKVQGNFGEMLLVDLLKSSGLQEGVHFVTQNVLRDAQGHEIKSEGGRTMLPDVIVYYPDDTELIIDSKVSLTAYTNYVAAQTLEERNRWAKAHVESVTAHINELKTKDYASYIDNGKRKVDYNIMFIPHEGAFRLMLEEAPLLWQQAKDAKVLIVSQMNLIIVLNMILMSWRQHDQEKNIEEVYNAASEMMGQIQNWLGSYVSLGEQLQKVQKTYDEATKYLKDSNQSVIKKIEKLEKLGVRNRRSKAKIKAGTRSAAAGFESVIPKALAEPGTPPEEEQEAAE